MNEELKKDLDEKTENAKVDNIRRYPLLEITSSRTELQDISKNTSDYMESIDPNVIVGKWELIPRVAMEFLKKTFEKLASVKTTAAESVIIEIGNIITAGIEYQTCAGEKEGTFNPIIKVGDALLYNAPVSIDQLQAGTHLISSISTNKKEIKDICEDVMSILRSKYGVTVDDWTLICFIFTSFMKQCRDYCVLHKEHGEYGLDIDLGSVINFGIEKIKGDTGSDYIIYISPGQVLKLITKDDGETEE